MNDFWYGFTMGVILFVPVVLFLLCLYAAIRLLPKSIQAANIFVRECKLSLLSEKYTKTRTRRIVTYVRIWLRVFWEKFWDGIDMKAR